MTIAKPPQFSSVKTFHSKDFELRYNAFRNAARQTPLVIMLWAPNPSTGAWAGLSKRILDELERLGHTVFYNEHLGISTSMRFKKGVEYQASDSVDLIVVVQPGYAPIGDVYDFEDMRIVDTKMLLFIDEAAPDRHLYDRALTLLKSRFNNVETFRNPQDIAQDVLLKKIVDKIGLMQMVKYRAIFQAKNWGIRTSVASVGPRQANAVRPFPQNLLELYQAHQDEIDTLMDPNALFILANVNQNGTLTRRTLWHAMGIAEQTMQVEMALLQHGEMIVETNGSVIVTDGGKQILSDVGLVASHPSIQVPRNTTAKPQRAATIAAIAGFALTAIFLVGLIAFYWLNTVESELPLAYTPTRLVPTVTRLSTPLPTLTLTPIKR
jgi:hypothetical protein